ncbi:unnamed protein product, partial [Hapterophycus canaliculatus]
IFSSADGCARVQVAAANAMTILCRSGRSFAGMDLSRIKV